MIVAHKRKELTQSIEDYRQIQNIDVAAVKVWAPRLQDVVRGHVHPSPTKEEASGVTVAPGPATRVGKVK